MACRLVALCCLVCLHGCTGSGGLLGIGGCSPRSYQLDFPAASGFAAAGTITSSTGCFSTAQVKTYASLGPIVGSAYPVTHPLLYLGVSFSNTEYANSLPALTLTIPSDSAASSRQYFMTSNFVNGSFFAWGSAVRGQLDASGTRVAFPASGGNVGCDANQVVEFFVYATGGP